MRKKSILFALLVFMMLGTTLCFAADVRLSWNPPATDEDGTPLTDLAGYVIYYGISPRTYSWSINAGNVTSYTVSNLTNGTYYFAVSAYDTWGNQSNYSNEVSRSVTSFSLAVNKSGTGSGTVTASGINCGSDCTESYRQGTIVSLTASPSPGSAFYGWTGGGCTGSGMCVISMNMNVTTTATFHTVPPIAGFTAYPTAVRAPLYVSFTDTSANNPTSWLWSFGDGTTSTRQHPVHTYTSPGAYTVSLTVSNATGSDSETKNSHITVSSPCTNQPVRIAGSNPRYFSTIQAAYDAAVNGDVIQVQAAELTGNVVLNRNISVTLKGGYDCNFSAFIQETIINGFMTTSNGGTVLIEHIVL